MRFLFVHQNFPGQFLHLVMRLVRMPGHEVVFISGENDNHIEGVRKVTYKVARGINPGTHPDAQDFEGAVLRAQAVATTIGKLRSLGFVPDVVIGHHGWGELLNLPDVLPGVPVLGYHEYFYHTSGLDVGFDPEFPLDTDGFARVRNKNAVNLLALANPGHGQTPTLFQHSTYPAWAQPGITVLPEGVDLQACRPDPAARSRPLELDGFTIAPGDTLVTYVARDLEPYRGFHTMMRALPRLMRLKPDLKVVLVGGDGVSYGARLGGNQTWREFMLHEVGRHLDLRRVHFPGRVSYEVFVKLLQRSDAHVYLTYPFVASWSMREALACGCAIVASDTAPVQEFVQDGETGLTTSCLDPIRLCDRVRELLDDPDKAQALRANARAFAERTLQMEEYLLGYGRLIDRVVNRQATGVSEAPSPAGMPG